MIAASGALLREVGAANRTGPDDYSEAIRENTAALMRVRTGHCVVAEHAAGVRWTTWSNSCANAPARLHHLGASSLVDLGEFGLPGAPVVSQSVKAAPTWSSSAAPSCWVDPSAGSSSAAAPWWSRSGATRWPGPAVGKLTLAGLAATLRLYQDPKRKARHEIPLLSLLAASPENLSGRAQRLAPQLAATGTIGQAAEPLAAVEPRRRRIDAGPTAADPLRRGPSGWNQPRSALCPALAGAPIAAPPNTERPPPARP